MHARISRAKIRAGAKQETQSFCERFTRQNDDVPGLKWWAVFITDENEVMVVSIFDTAANRDRTADINSRRWDSAKHLLQGPPIDTHSDVISWPM